MGDFFGQVALPDYSNALLSLAGAQQDAAKTNVLWNQANTGQQDLADRATLRDLAGGLTARAPNALGTAAALGASGQGAVGVLSTMDAQTAQAKLAQLQFNQNLISFPGGGGAPPAAVPAGGSSGIEAALGQGEGGNKPGVVNGQGYSGQFQFGTGRLTDLGMYQPAQGENPNGNQWQGTFSVPGMPQVQTYQQFLASPDAQRVAMHVHVGDILQQVANTPGANQYNPMGLVAVAHLGGVGGMQKFVATGGQYNPADANGTKLSDYYNRYSQVGGAQQLAQDHGHPGGPIPGWQWPGQGGQQQPAAPVQVASAAGTNGMPHTATDAAPGGPVTSSTPQQVQDLMATLRTRQAGPGGAGAGPSLPQAAAPAQGQDAPPSMAAPAALPPSGYMDAGISRTPVVPGVTSQQSAPSAPTRAAPGQNALLPVAGPAPSPMQPNALLQLAGGQQPGTVPPPAPGARQPGTVQNGNGPPLVSSTPGSPPSGMASPSGAPPGSMQQPGVTFARTGAGKFVTEGLPPGYGLARMPDGSTGVAMLPGAAPTSRGIPVQTAGGTAIMGPEGQRGPVVPFSGRPEQEKAYNADIERTGQITQAAQTAQANMPRLNEVADLAQQLATGPTADVRARAAAYLEQAGVGPDAIQRFTGMPSGAAAQEFTKLNLTLAGAASKGDVGSNNGIQSVQLYQQANPGLALLPDANKRITNMMRVSSQATQDYAQGALQHFGTNEQQFLGGGNYTPLTSFNRQWQAQNNPQVYAAATGILNGDPFAKWSARLNGADEGQRAAQIAARVDPNAMVPGRNGGGIPARQFLQMQGR